MLAAEHLSKRYDSIHEDEGTEALRDVSFALNVGDFVSLLGPSGCGKSTALRLVAGLLKPDAGYIEWDNKKPDIGFVFQEPTLMPWADARANVRLPLDLKAVPHREGNARAEIALTRVGLAGFARAFPRELSGGMKMRVSIARALAASSRLLLLDEPFAALDEMSRVALNDDLLRLWREDELTVLFVTHSVAESCYLSERVLVMSPRPGRIAADIPLPPQTGRSTAFRLSPQFIDCQRQVSLALGEASTKAEETNRESA